MSLKALFGEVAGALGHLRSAAENTLFSDQKAEIDATLVKLRDAETNLDKMIAKDVAAAVPGAIKAALADAIAPLQQSVNDLSARMDQSDSDIEQGLAQIRDAVGLVAEANAPASGGEPTGAVHSDGEGAGASTDAPLDPGTTSSDASATSTATTDGEGAAADTSGETEAGSGSEATETAPAATDEGAATGESAEGAEQDGGTAEGQADPAAASDPDSGGTATEGAADPAATETGDGAAS